MTAPPLSTTATSKLALPGWLALFWVPFWLADSVRR
jgi:hypothetical protein